MGKRDIKVVSYVMIGGNPVEFGSLDETTKQTMREKLLKNAGDALSTYYSAHPEEAGFLFKDNKND